MALVDDLASAKAARHALLTGKAVTQFRDANGDFVSYTKADLQALNQYIAELVATIAAEEGIVPAPYTRGPMRYFI